MKSYRFLCDIIYEGKKFKIFSDNNFKKTFLRVLDDNELCYATLEDYVKLDKIYNKTKSDIVYKIGSYKFKPGAITRGGKLLLGSTLATTLATTLVSSSQELEFNEHEQMLNTSPVIEEQQDITEIPSEQNFNEIVNGQNAEDRVIIEQDEDLTNWLYKTENKIYVKNNDEFRQYVENKNPTFDDVREVIEKNQNLDLNIKEILYEYLTVLEEKCPDIDLVCFYHNVERLEVEVLSKEKMEETYDSNINGAYNTLTGIISIREDELGKEVVYHEVSHMLNQSAISVDNTIVYRRAQSYILDEQNNLICIGTGYSEGLIENILIDVFEIDINMNIGIYSDYTDIVNLIIGTTNISIIDMLNNDTRYIIEKLKEEGIKDAKHIIELIDTMGTTMINEEIEAVNDFRVEIYSLYFENLFEQKVKDGWTVEEIYYYTLDILKNNYIQRTHGDENPYFIEQSDVNDKILRKIYSSSAESPKYTVKETTEDFVCINLEAPENPIEVYLAKKDEQGNIMVYDKNSLRQVNIDTSYGEFAKTLEKNGIITYDELQEEKNVMNKEEFIEYCKKRECNKNKLNSNNNITDYKKRNNDGSYIIFNYNTGLDLNKYKFYESSLKTYNKIEYYYDSDNKLEEIITYSDDYDNNKNHYIENISFLPNGDYNQEITYYDINGVEYENKEIEYQYENSKMVVVNTKNKWGKFDETVTKYDYTVISPYIFDGYFEKGDCVSQTLNGEMIVEKKDDITYVHTHHNSIDELDCARM